MKKLVIILIIIFLLILFFTPFLFGPSRPPNYELLNSNESLGEAKTTEELKAEQNKAPKANGLLKIYNKSH